MRRRYAVCSEGIILFAHFFLFSSVLSYKNCTHLNAFTQNHWIWQYFLSILRWQHTLALLDGAFRNIIHALYIVILSSIYLTIYLSISIHIYIYLYIYVYCIYVFIDRSFYRVFIKNSVFLNSLQPIPCV